ncbi:MAG: hypothetical protein ACXWRA_03650 [Pseudobdellovibrionaceae bacterium]
MESLFRFMLTRNAVTDETLPPISLTQKSTLQDAINQANNGRNFWVDIKTAAKNFIGTPQYISNPKSIGIYPKWKTFADQLDALQKKASISENDLDSAAMIAFSMKMKDLKKNDEIAKFIPGLRDSMVAIKILPEEHRRPIDVLGFMLRDFDLIVNFDLDIFQFPMTGLRLKSLRRRAFQLPEVFDSKPSRATEAAMAPSVGVNGSSDWRTKAKALLTKFMDVRTAISELTSIHPAGFEATVQKASQGSLVPANLRPQQVLSNLLNMQQQILGKSDTVNSGTTHATLPLRIEDLPDLANKNTNLSLLNPPTQLFQTGSPNYNPSLNGPVVRLKPEVANGLGATTKSVLSQYKLDAAQQPLNYVVKELTADLFDIGQTLTNLFERPQKISMSRIGTDLMVVKRQSPSAFTDVINDMRTKSLDEIIQNFENLHIGSVADLLNTHGTVSPSGVADLMIVKQHLAKYESSDVSYIENVLLSETRNREHSRRETTEQITTTESEVTAETEKSLESTDRYEMSRESSETIKEDASFKGSASLSGSYGPSIEFAVSAEGGYAQSKEESTKTAAKFSKDVTQKSSEKITQRLLQRVTTTLTTEVIEKDTHGFDNTKGPKNISGVYQWVNKVYQAQMYNYGARTLFDFMVPEPAAYLIDTMTNAHNAAIELKEPMPFKLRPDQLDEHNYTTYVQAYSVSDVTPPPEIYMTKAVEYNTTSQNDDQDFAHSGVIVIDDGYMAISGRYSVLTNIWDDNCSVDASLGSFVYRFRNNESWTWTTSLNQDRGSISFGAQTYKISSLVINIEVLCQRTERAMDKWRLETHAKITAAYKAQLADYEDKLANLKLQSGVTIRGKNPNLNLEIMRDELKKNCVSLLTAQHFDLFDAVEDGTDGKSQINLSEALIEGSYVRFFEQAFEWENMTWVTYPYFWGRKGTWADRVSYEDVDPEFNQFLKAGSCRVVVPIRPHFEQAVDHFMKFGELWNGGSLPTVSDSLYLPIATEISERLNIPGDEIPVGDPWLVRVPTSLIKLRSDDRLPVWQQDQSGEWAEQP